MAEVGPEPQSSTHLRRGQGGAAAGVHDRSSGVDLLGLFGHLDSGGPVDLGSLATYLADADDALVTRVRSVAVQLDRLRRRDRELTALMASTHDLLDVHDAPGVLNRIVDRAHDLIGTDVTYMSMYVPDSHELFVRAVRGVLTPEFLGMRVPAGIGIASRVVAEVAPHWTSDYWRDPTISHDPTIDRTLEDETLRSLLGVPVAADGEVLGVLFAADRAAHSFSNEQVALLSAFADQAAVILRATALLAEAQQRASDAHERAEEMSAAALVHGRLTELVLAGHGPEKVAEALGESLGRAVVIAERGMTPPASVHDGAPWWVDGILHDRVARAASQSHRSGRSARVDGLDGAEVVAAVVSGSNHLGAVLVGSGDQRLSDIELRTVERSAQIVALLTMQRQAMADAEERVRGELALDLLSSQVESAAVRRRALARDIDVDAPWLVAAIDVPLQNRQAVLREVSSGTGWLATLHHGGLSILVPLGDGRADADRVAEHVRLRTASTAPASRTIVATADRATELAEAVRETWDCAALVDGLGGRAGLHRVEDYAPFLAMFGTDAPRAKAYVERVIGALIEWDERHHTELLATLLAFVDARHSATRAARALIVHPNTVKQRMDRIGVLLGPDWRDPNPLFRVTVAARLHHAVTAVAVPERT